MPRILLKSFRKSLNLTQEQMADKWDITVSHYKQIECGAKNPSINKLKIFKQKFPLANIDEIFLS